MYNIPICQDILRHYKRKNQPSRCTMKIDLRKAYDSVRWEFLGELLDKFHFPERFRKWIMTCVTFPYFLNQCQWQIVWLFQRHKKA